MVLCNIFYDLLFKLMVYIVGRFVESGKIGIELIVFGNVYGIEIYYYW